MNGFSAADMSTAAANGHAEGHQAGYADAVKAFDAAQPAAAQEAAPWRDHDAAIDAKALSTATEIALMWGQDRSQFISRIQVAVIDAMRWVKGGLQPAAAQEAVGVDAYDDALDQLWKLAGGNDHPVYKRFLDFRDSFAAPVTAAPADDEEDAYVIDQMGKLLAEIAVIVNGPEPAGTRWSYHDLPAKVRALASTPAAPGIDWLHIANEYADATCNGIQWLRNIRDGISAVDDALADMEANYARIQNLQSDASPKDSLNEQFGSAEGLGDLPGMWEKADLVGGATDSEDGPKGGREARLQKMVVTLAPLWRLSDAWLEASDYPGEKHRVMLGCAKELRDKLVQLQAQASDAEVRPCETCGPDGIMATDGTGPFDCYACGKKANSHGAGVK